MKNLKKFWKIGTNIFTYLSELKDKKPNYLSEFIILKQTTDLNKEIYSLLSIDDHTFRIINQNEKSTFFQKIRVLCFLGILKIHNFDEEIYKLDNFAKEFESRKFIWNIKFKKDWDIYDHILVFLDNQYTLINQTLNWEAQKISFFFSFALSFVLNKLFQKNWEEFKKITQKLNLDKKDLNYYYDDEFYKKISNHSNLPKIIIEFLEKNDFHIEKISENIDLEKNVLSHYENTLLFLKQTINDKENLIGFPEKRKIIHPSSETFNLANFFWYIYYNRNQKLKIPVFQRKISWTKNIVYNLLEDIKNVSDYTREYIYLGVLTCTALNNNKNFKNIIDGQQRLSTLLLIFNALSVFTLSKNFFSEEEFEINLEFMKNEKIISFLNIFNKSSDNENSIIYNYFIRIQGNNDYEEFEKVLNLKNFDKVDSKISKILYDILIWIINNFKNSQQKLFNFWQAFLHKIYFIIVDLENINEFDLFERMNTRQRPLNAIELVKNRIYSEFENEIINASIEKEFQLLFDKQIFSKFWDVKKNDIFLKKINDFLWYIDSIYSDDEWGEIKSENDDTIDLKLYSKFWIFIKEQIIERNLNNKINFKECISKISDEIDLFFELTTPEKYFSENQRFYFISSYLYSLMPNSKTIYIPLISSIIKAALNEDVFNFSDQIKNIKVKNIIIDCLKVIQSFEIKRQMIAQKGESLISFLSKVLRDLKKNDNLLNPKAIFNILKTYKHFDKINDLKTLWNKVSGDALTQHEKNILLVIFEWYIFNEEWTLKFFENHDLKIKNQFTLEHIAPKKLNLWYENYKYSNNEKKQLESYIENIGNFLLLKQKTNAKNSNNIFSKKKVIYASSFKNTSLATLKGVEGSRFNIIINDIKELINKYNYDKTGFKKWIVKPERIEKSLNSLNLLVDHKMTFNWEDIELRSEAIAWVICLALSNSNNN
ncbi:DUF262 domain-containing protein [Mesomycoplasma neurolyticum]|uniref:Protein of uncharacterized function DUF262 n=1 Tax=Mesomycoplasma neurolyticum TaxID=2120 RepID=A0A449A628_9BACT|nr:DUF262 domain-containing protein [Mesomycoplasma neurolyticum]VEU59679.1 Protein of uncharacterised function DUF262 [Mesomycoplasma neurolyticum]